MLKKILLVTPGRYEKDELTSKGIEDVHWLAQQINEEERSRPGIVFFTNEKYCMYSALILAGLFESIKHVASLGSSFEIPYHELSSDLDLDDENPKKRIWTIRKMNAQNRKRADFWKQFRDALRTEETARAYLGKTCLIPNDIEEVAIVSIPGFGGVFPKRNKNIIFSYTCWVTPVAYTLDISKQTLSLSCNPRERFGCV